MLFRSYPPGTQFASNGLPLVRLPYRNDDGGPGFGKDSRLRFTAPADGDYVIKLRDVRGLSGEDYAYRLTLHPSAPDFQLSVNPRNANVPLGGRIPLTVTAFRMDDFDGPIEVSLEDLPAGIQATKGVSSDARIATDGSSRYRCACAASQPTARPMAAPPTTATTNPPPIWNAVT